MKKGQNPAFPGFEQDKFAKGFMESLIKLNPTSLQNKPSDDTPVPIWTASKALEYADALLEEEEK